MSVYFKTLENRTLVDPKKISEKIFPWAVIAWGGTLLLMFFVKRGLRQLTFEQYQSGFVHVRKSQIQGLFKDIQGHHVSANSRIKY
jgi:hypothetical protein